MPRSRIPTGCRCWGRRRIPATPGTPRVSRRPVRTRSCWRSAPTTWRSRSRGLAYRDITREFASLSQLADTVAKSRIWGGIHYQFDTDASQVACTKVAEYVFANFMRPAF